MKIVLRMRKWKEGLEKVTVKRYPESMKDRSKTPNACVNGC